METITIHTNSLEIEVPFCHSITINNAIHNGPAYATCVYHYPETDKVAIIHASEHVYNVSDLPNMDFLYKIIYHLA